MRSPLRQLKRRRQLNRFKSFGRQFYFDPDGTYTHDSISVGDNVNLGLRPTLIASRSEIVIGNNVMFGPEVTVRGGNHRIDVVGVPMIAVTDQDKRPQDDPGVVIEDDVWIGTRAVILAGVTIHRGSVVAAGAVVTRSVPPYTIVAGNPARPIRTRFTVGEAELHESSVYPPEERLSNEELTQALEPDPPGSPGA